MHIRVNSPQVIHETIDGEVIVINLATGSYYSLKGSAADVWELIGAPSGVDTARLFESLSARFAVTPGDLESAFTPFLFELEAEGLVSGTGVSSPVAALAARGSSNGVPGAPSGFELPQLEKYTDMQDLVLLDPVHEVDPTGWPNAQASGMPGGSH